MNRRNFVLFGPGVSLMPNFPAAAGQPPDGVCPGEFIVYDTVYAGDGPLREQ
jgi:hypothetical protein